MERSKVGCSSYDIWNPQLSCFPVDQLINLWPKWWNAFIAIQLCFPTKVLGSNLVTIKSYIRHSAWPVICLHSILGQIWTDDRGPPAKHCFCSVVSFHVRKLRNHHGVGGCLFHVPMVVLFHKGWSVNSRLVLTAANEKHKPFLNICQVPLSVLCQYSWIWQEHILFSQLLSLFPCCVLTVCLKFSPKFETNRCFNL